MSEIKRANQPWRRSPDGILAGVCAGVAAQVGVEAWVVRLIWGVAVIFFGTGLLAYAIAWICMPSAAASGVEKRLLGVCVRVAARSDLDIAVARLLACLLLIVSGGSAIVGYLVLYFLLPAAQPSPSSMAPASVNSPS